MIKQVLTDRHAPPRRLNWFPEYRLVKEIHFLFVLNRWTWPTFIREKYPPLAIGYNRSLHCLQA